MRRMTAVRWCFVLAVSAPGTAAACGGPFFSAAESPDAAMENAGGAGGAAGAGGVSGEADADASDAPADVPIDRRDGAGGDASEAGPDADASDTAADGSDAGTHMGCADGTVEQEYSAKMHGCDGEKTQCDAESLCASGWHLCTMSEYVSRGGATTPASVRRWIASCIRTGCGAPTYPTDEICGGVCENAMGSMPDMVWDCSGSLADTESNCAVGLVSHGGTLRLGSQASACVYARQLGTNGAVGAVCCRQ